MPMAPMEALQARLDRMVREDGLVDFKFTLADVPGATADGVSLELLSMLDDWKAGRTVPLSFGDSRRGRT